MAKDKKDKKKKSQKVRLDVKKDTLKGIAVGRKVRVSLEGIVHSASMPYEYAGHCCDNDVIIEEPYGDVTINVSSVSIKNASDNEFTEMVKDE